MKFISIEKIEPELARCISVESTDRLFAAGGLDGVSVVSHNSVIQRNIIMGCILRPESWRFIGIDLKKVELSAYRAYSNVVLGIATELEDALTVLRFAQTTMMKRYQEMESVGESNFLDMPNHGPALMVMIDEAGELLSPSGVKNDEGKLQDELKGEAQVIIGSIARLGRAAGVHLVIATQRPDATLLPGETKANLGARVNAGRTDGNASSMILENGEGTRVSPFPPGRLYVKIYSVGDHGQGFFCNSSWIDEYLRDQGLNPDGTPLAGGRKATRKANIVDLNEFAEADLDSKEGIDTQGSIEDYIKEEEQELEEEVRGAPGSATPANAIRMEEREEGDMTTPLLLDGGGNKKDQFARPEDSWDSEFEELIDENFEENQ